MLPVIYELEMSRMPLSCTWHQRLSHRFGQTESNNYLSSIDTDLLQCITPPLIQLTQDDDVDNDYDNR